MNHKATLLETGCDDDRATRTRWPRKTIPTKHHPQPPKRPTPHPTKSPWPAV